MGDCGDGEQVVCGARGVGRGAEAADDPDGGVAEEGVGEAPAEGPEGDGVGGEVVEALEREASGVGGFDPLAHRVHALDAESALREAHGQLLVGRGLAEVLGAEPVDDDHASAGEEMFGRVGEKAAHAFR